MNNIEELCCCLAAEKNNLTRHSARISRMNAEIEEAMTRVETYFSDQPAGQSIARLLSLAQHELVIADNAFYALGNEITTYVAELRK